MIQKILKVGKLAVVKIPKEFLDELGLKIGDQINVIVEKPTEYERKFLEIYQPDLKALEEK